MTWIIVAALWCVSGLIPLAISLWRDRPRGWRCTNTTDGWGAVLFVYVPAALVLGALVPIGTLVGRALQARSAEG